MILEADLDEDEVTHTCVNVTEQKKEFLIK